jgi:cell division protein ZapA (FtsZ GTPase activity inhibitor)
MSEITLRILDQDIRFACAPEEERRLRDLAAALETRLAGFSGDGDGMRRLILTALSLMDEAQAAGAALARAHGEIERLNDLLEETQPDPQREAPRVSLSEAFGQVGSLSRTAMC